MTRAKERKGKAPRRSPRVAVDNLFAGELLLEGDRAHYLLHVMRLRVDDSVFLFDGIGGTASAKIIGTPKQGLTLLVDEAQRPPPVACFLTVAMAVPKGERADWAVEKLTETGVARIIWIDASRSTLKTKPRDNRRQRWERLVKAAASQSGRAGLTQIDGPVPLQEIFELRAERRLIAHSGGPALVAEIAGKSPSSAILLVGPEGGFTTEELAEARGAGYTWVGLGPHTLRMETAAVVGAAIIVGGAVAKGHSDE